MLTPTTGRQQSSTFLTVIPSLLLMPIHQMITLECNYHNTLNQIAAISSLSIINITLILNLINFLPLLQQQNLSNHLNILVLTHKPPKAPLPIHLVYPSNSMVHIESPKSPKLTNGNQFCISNSPMQVYMQSLMKYGICQI